MEASSLSESEILELRRYLLNKLTKDEEEQVEVRLMTDAGYAEELDMVVDEITDDYVANVLPGDELKLVESYFLQSQERREKLEFVRALSDYQANLAPHPPVVVNEVIPAAEHVKPPAFLPTITASWLFRVAAALAAVGLLVAVFSLWRARTTPPRYLAVTLNLTASNRGNKAAPATKISFPENVEVLRVSLVLPEGLTPEANYQVQLISENGDTRSLDITGRDGHSIMANIPRAQLKSGSYALKLSTIKADGLEVSMPGSYLFVVE